MNSENCRLKKKCDNIVHNSQTDN